MSKELKLPVIPDKRYFTIGETSKLCGVEPHVLRYWEKEFPQLKPITRRGNRRYYQHDDVILVRNIRTLLYEEGFTISGARQQLLNAKAVKIGAANDEKIPNVMQEICEELFEIAMMLRKRQKLPL
jgi:DNA-binding transcriptional MerR regulator